MKTIAVHQKITHSLTMMTSLTEHLQIWLLGHRLVVRYPPSQPTNRAPHVTGKFRYASWHAKWEHGCSEDDGQKNMYLYQLGKNAWNIGMSTTQKGRFPLQRNFGHLVGLDLKGNFGNF